MAKYRQLSIEELKELEGPFIRFLAANSITAEDWKIIQKNDPARQDTLIAEFSDVVFEKTLHNVQFLEQRTEKRILYYHFEDKKAEVVGIEFSEKPKIDLSGAFKWSILLELLKSKEVKYSFIHGEKKYTKDKFQEIFEILNQGSGILEDGILFNSMLNLLKE